MEPKKKKKKKKKTTVIKLTRVLCRQENGTYSIPGIFRHPDGNRHGRYPAFPGQQFGTGVIRGIAQSHPVGIIGPVITGNAFFPIWYHIHGFVGPRELGWSDTLYCTGSGTEPPWLASHFIFSELYRAKMLTLLS